MGGRELFKKMNIVEGGGGGRESAGGVLGAGGSVKGMGERDGWGFGGGGGGGGREESEMLDVIKGTLYGIIWVLERRYQSSRTSSPVCIGTHIGTLVGTHIGTHAGTQVGHLC
jgi:hypothetical protein